MPARRTIGKRLVGVMIVARGGATRSRVSKKSPRLHHSSASATSAWSSAAGPPRCRKGRRHCVGRVGDPSHRAGAQVRRYARPEVVQIRPECLSEGVILLADRGGEPYRTLSWHHDIGELQGMRGLLEPASTCAARRVEGSLSLRSSPGSLRVYRDFLHDHEV
jgi:hypothetical protein